MDIFGVLFGTAGNGHGDRVACSHWTAEEADRTFGRRRQRTGTIYCDDDRCNTPAR